MSTREEFLIMLSQSLESIRDPRFFQTERGYQGELLAELRKRLRDVALPGDPVVEQEYQKRIPDHGIKIRPDIIIHIPFERDTAGRRDEGNFVAIELKLRATEKDALWDFTNLAQMHECFSIR